MDFDQVLERVTIRDILTDAGFDPKGSRMACPIHGGKNSTSFSFGDHVYTCFACGASGGLISLAQELHGYLALKLRSTCVDLPVCHRIGIGRSRKAGYPGG